jgi:hypothetical protein
MTINTSASRKPHPHPPTHTHTHTHPTRSSPLHHQSWAKQKIEIIIKISYPQNPCQNHGSTCCSRATISMLYMDIDHQNTYEDICGPTLLKKHYIVSYVIHGANRRQRRQKLTSSSEAEIRIPSFPSHDVKAKAETREGE